MQTFCQVGNSMIKTFHLIRFLGGMTLGWYWDENIWSHQLSLGCKLFVCDQNISSHRILSRCDNWKGFYLAIIKKWSYLVMILHELDNHPEVVGVVFDGNHLGLVLLLICPSKKYCQSFEVLKTRMMLAASSASGSWQYLLARRRQASASFNWNGPWQFLTINCSRSDHIHCWDKN